MQNLTELTRRYIQGRVEFVLIRAKEATDRDHDRITVNQLKEIKRRLNPG
jgi:hypothetical protein